MFVETVSILRFKDEHVCAQYISIHLRAFKFIEFFGHQSNYLILIEYLRT